MIGTGGAEAADITVSDSFFHRPPEINLAGLFSMARARDRAEIANALARAPEDSVLALSPDLARSIGVGLQARWVVDTELVPFSWELRLD